MELQAQPLEIVLAFFFCICLFLAGGSVCTLVSSSSKRRFSLWFPIGISVFMILNLLVPLLGISPIILILFPLIPALYYLLRKKLHRPNIIFKPASILMVVGILFIAAQFPIVFQSQTSFDILSYHLPIAHLLLDNVFLYHSPYDYYLNLPYGAFSLYLPFLSDRATTLDDPGVRVLLFCCFANICFLARLIVGHLGGRVLAQNTVFLMLSCSLLIMGPHLNSNSDMITAVLFFAGIERLLSAQKTSRAIDYGLSGFLIASTISIKMSSLGILVFPVFFTLLIKIIVDWKLSGKWVVKPVIIFILCGILSYLPWGIRALLIAGNPLFPLVGTTDFWTNGQQEFLLEQHQPTTPFGGEHFARMFTKWEQFGYSLQILSPNGIAMILPPIFLIAVFGAVIWMGFHLRNKKNLIVLQLFTIIFGGYSAWALVGLAPARFALPLFLLGICFAVWLFGHEIARRKPILGYLPLGLYLLSQMWIYWPNYTVSWNSANFDRNAVFPEMIMVEQRELAGDGKTWVLFESRDRWFSEPLASNKVWNPLPFADELKESETVSVFIDKLIENNVQCIVVNDFELGRLVDFYGDDDGKNTPQNWGQIGVKSRPEAYQSRLAQFPPVEFADLTNRDLEILVEFLQLSFRQASFVTSAGPEAAIWISPLPKVPVR